MAGYTGSGTAAYGMVNTAIASSGYISPPADQPSTPSKIRDRITDAEGLLNELHATIEVVERRLETVLTPTPSPPISDSNKAQAISSSVDGRLQNVNEGIGAAIRRIHALLNRVEV